MVEQVKCWFWIVVFFITLNLIGCGGGGGKGVDNRASDTPNVTTFKVPASTAVIKNVGVLAIEIPKAAFPAGADITVSQAEPSDRPPNEEFKPLDQGEIEISASAAPQAPLTLTLNSANRVQSFGASQEIYLYMTKTASGWAIQNAGTSQIVISVGQFVASGIKSSAKGLVGKIVVSEFLRTLNTPTMMQRGLVDYCFIGTNRDEIVGQKSGTAENIPLESFTAGRVYRHSESGDHSSLVNNEGGWQILQQYLANGPRSDGLVSIELDPNPVDASWDGWYFSMMITNHGDQEIQLLDLSFDAYDRDGKWFDLEWYDPGTAPGVFFPNEHVTLDISISAQENYSCNLRECFDYDRDTIDNAPEIMKAHVLVFTLRYQVQGVTKLVTTQLVCQSTGNVPQGPSVRSLAIHSGPARSGTRRGATMRVK